jgi:transcriptional regulator GlxA family with amidase domain
MKKITILCSNHCLSSSITGFIDAFEIANRLWRQSHEGAENIFEWKLVSSDGQSITASNGLQVAMDGKLPMGKSDIIYIPACQIISEELLLKEVDEVVDWSGRWIDDQYKFGATIAIGSCGSFVLGKIGLLKDKQIAAGWWLKSLITTIHPDIQISTNHTVIQSDRIISAGPINSHYNLALKVIEQVSGKYLSAMCMRTLLTDQGSVASLPYEPIQLVMTHTDEEILAAQQWIQKHLHEAFRIQDVANHVHLSERTFLRRFKTATGIAPIEYIKQLKVDLAKHLLETSSLSIKMIVKKIGYNDESTFTALFKKYTHHSPTLYREKFSFRSNGS